MILLWCSSFHCQGCAVQALIWTQLYLHEQFQHDRQCPWNRMLRPPAPLQTMQWPCMACRQRWGQLIDWLPTPGEVLAIKGINGHLTLFLWIQTYYPLDMSLLCYQLYGPNKHAWFCRKPFVVCLQCLCCGLEQAVTQDVVGLQGWRTTVLTIKKWCENHV